MRFSERIGVVPIKDFIQIGSINDALRNRLWNCLDVYIWSRKGGRWSNNCKISGILDVIWDAHFKIPLKTMPSDSNNAIQFIWNQFKSCPWYEIYDLIELLASTKQSVFFYPDFIKVCNAVLEEERSGYRFVNGMLSPIVAKEEILEIQNAINITTKSGLDTVQEHLESALQKLSDRKNPDYRNSIKESISAVESLAIIISKNPKANLHDALKLIENPIDLDPALRAAFSNLYGYTSSSDGIRHALTEKSSVDIDDARYMLVTCSAFINYLISKCTKNGIELN